MLFIKESARSGPIFYLNHHLTLYKSFAESHINYTSLISNYRALHESLHSLQPSGPTGRQAQLLGEHRPCPASSPIRRRPDSPAPEPCPASLRQPPSDHTLLRNLAPGLLASTLTIFPLCSPPPPPPLLQSHSLSYWPPSAGPTWAMVTAPLREEQQPQAAQPAGAGCQRTGAAEWVLGPKEAVSLWGRYVGDRNQIQSNRITISKNAHVPLQERTCNSSHTQPTWDSSPDLTEL